MKKTKRLFSLFICFGLFFSMTIQYVSAEKNAEYATREYIISEFVKSVGRNQLTESDAVLDIFFDAEKISGGGSLFSNTLNIKRQSLSDLIRLNEDKEFVRTLMLMSPDTVNAWYIKRCSLIKCCPCKCDSGIS